MIKHVFRQTLIHENDTIVFMRKGEQLIGKIITVCPELIKVSARKLGVVSNTLNPYKGYDLYPKDATDIMEICSMGTWVSSGFTISIFDTSVLKVGKLLTFNKGGGIYTGMISRVSPLSMICKVYDAISNSLQDCMLSYGYCELLHLWEEKDA